MKNDWIQSASAKEMENILEAAIREETDWEELLMDMPENMHSAQALYSLCDTLELPEIYIELCSRFRQFLTNEQKVFIKEWGKRTFDMEYLRLPNRSPISIALKGSIL